MRFISLFAGIGGLDLGLERAGMECVAQVEIDDFCQQVLTKHWPNVPKHKDVCDVGKQNLPATNLICGGFPCQDVSVAGFRNGLEGERSTLWKEFYRIVCEIHPQWVVIENVTGLLSSDNGKFFSAILWNLSEIGYDVEWETISAAAMGALHQRERVFIVANCNGLRMERSWAEQQTAGINECFGSYWRDTKPPIYRVANGVPYYMDRIKSHGNSVVPQVAEFIGHCIMNTNST